MEENRYDNNIRVFSDLNYWKWLDKFTQKYQVFSDVNILYNTKSLIKEDITNINNLRKIFNVIYNYGKNSFISMNSEIYGYSYTIKKGDIYYDFGYLEDLNAISYFCRRSKNRNSYIEYNDIINNTKISNKEEIYNLFEKISECVDELDELGIDRKIIVEYIGYNKKVNKIK